MVVDLAHIIPVHFGINLLLMKQTSPHALAESPFTHNKHLVTHAQTKDQPDFVNCPCWIRLD